MVTAGNQLPTWPAELINEQKKWTRNKMVGGNEGNPHSIPFKVSGPERERMESRREQILARTFPPT